MKILDTNLWVFGTFGTNDRAERLLEDIEEGETVSAINAYMVQNAQRVRSHTRTNSEGERRTEDGVPDPTDSNDRADRSPVESRFC